MPFAFFYSRQTFRKTMRNRQSWGIYQTAIYKRFKDGGHYQDAMTASRKSFANREAGGKLNERLRRGDKIVIDDHRYAFSSRKNLVIQVDAWHKIGVSVHIQTLGLHTNTIRGRSMIAAWVAIMEAGFEVGHPTHFFKRESQVPFGWRDMKRTIPHEEERAFMLKVWELRRLGWAWNQIAQEFTDKGFVQPRTGTAIDWGYVSRTHTRLMKMVKAGEMELPNMETGNG